MRDAMICFVMLTLVFHVFVDRLRHDRLVIDMKHADSRIIELQKQLNELRIERATPLSHERMRARSDGRP